MKCPHCGQEHEDDALFCPETRLSLSMPQQREAGKRSKKLPSWVMWGCAGICVLTALIVIAVLFGYAILRPEDTPEEVAEVYETINSSDGFSIEEVAEVHEMINNSDGFSIDLNGGFSINVPPGALYEEESEVSVEEVEDVSGYQSDSFAVIGKVYEVRLANGNPFRKAIELVIPYDENQIPDHRTEGDIFPMYYQDGQWIRTHGTVDRERNLITVYAAHNDDWTTGVYTTGEWSYENLNAANKEAIDWFKSAFVVDTQVLQDVALRSAEENVQQRQLELDIALLNQEWETEEFLDEMPWAKIDEIGEHLIIHAGSEAMVHLITAWGGKGAVVMIAGTPALIWGANTMLVGYSCYYAFIFGLEGGDALYYRLDVVNSAKRLQEAESVLWMLQNPDATSIHPVDMLYLNSYYYNTPISQTDVGFGDWDFDWTAFTDDQTTVTAVPTYTISTMLREKDGMEMVYVPAGNFTMGSEQYSNEEPVHEVFLDAYWIDKYEVTNGQYEQCVAAGACSQPQSMKSDNRSSYYENEEYENYPVVYTDWNDAVSYCEWAGGGLPTEAQWEKAARGTDERMYPWGNETPTCSLVNYGGCAGDTSEVGSYPTGASPYGALDMAGNVWEWVADWYDSGYYSNSPAENPSGPTSGTYRVLRGGSWDSNDNFVRSANRNWDYPSYAGYVVGFRCVRTIEN